MKPLDVAEAYRAQLAKRTDVNEVSTSTAVQLAILDELRKITVLLELLTRASWPGPSA